MMKKENIFVELGKFYKEQNKVDMAIETLKEALGIFPDSELAHFEMGNIYVKMRDDGHAEIEYKKALELNQHFYEAALELGKIYRRQGRIELAAEEFKRALTETPRNWDALYELGKIYKERGDYESAAEKLKSASEIAPEREQVHFELGKIYRDIDIPELSIREFEKVLYIGNNQNDTFIKNKVLNEIEITEKKIVLASKVRAIVAMIINRCNLKCIICDIWKSTWQASQETMDEIVNLFPYIEDMVWEGGEVFLMKGFDGVLEESARYPHLKQVIFTNGVLLNEKVVEKLINFQGNLDIVFSIDGVTKETYEYIRKGGRFDRLTKNLLMLKGAREKNHSNIQTYFNAVVMKSNYHELEGFIDFAKEYGFNAVTLTPIRGNYGEENIFENQNQEALGHIKRVVPKITRAAQEYGIRLLNWIPGMHEKDCVSSKGDPPCSNLRSDTSSSGIKNRGDKRIICYAPWQRLVIDNEGQVRPFVFCLNKWIGNTKTNSLEELWNCEAMQEYRKRLINHDYMDLCQPECISGQVANKIRDIE